MSVTTQDIEQLLRHQLQPISLEVIDDSHLHAGHADAGIGTHYTVKIVSEQFIGQSRVKQHRLVYDALEPLMHNGIHALAIQAQAPAA